MPFFVQITRALSVGNLSNICRACSFVTISDLFCIDNARVVGRKIRYLQFCRNNTRKFNAVNNKSRHKIRCETAKAHVYILQNTRFYHWVFQFVKSLIFILFIARFQINKAMCIKIACLTQSDTV